MRRKISPHKHKKRFYLLIGFFLLFGLFLIYNATAYYAQTVFLNPFRFVYLQLMWVILGILLFIFFSNYDYHKLKLFTSLFFLSSLMFLILLGFSGLFLCRFPEDEGTIFIPCINGASRWFYFNPSPLPQIPMVGVLGFQPAELAKLSLILYLAMQLNKFSETKRGNKDSFLVFIVTTLIFSSLLLLQPNMSTAVLIVLIAFTMYFISGLSLKPLIVASPFLIGSGLLLMLSSGYRRQRFLTLLGLDSQQDTDYGYHIKQVMIALGSGGMFGLGFGQSRQKYQYLPEISSDSIFAIIGEEFGFIGSVVVIALFGYFIFLGLGIAKDACDNLGRLLAGGIVSWIAMQFFINIAAMTKLIPLTGMPIPLISYGGSSVVFSLIGLGILSNVHRQSESKDS